RDDHRVGHRREVTHVENAHVERLQVLECDGGGLESRELDLLAARSVLAPTGLRVRVGAFRGGVRVLRLWLAAGFVSRGFRHSTPFRECSCERYRASRTWGRGLRRSTSGGPSTRSRAA